MNATIKIGRKEGFISSYNLFFGNGLRLKTDDMSFTGKVDRELIYAQFVAVVESLRSSGWTIDGEVER